MPYIVTVIIISGTQNFPYTRDVLLNLREKQVSVWGVYCIANVI